jgi:hypothetical protein
MQQKLLLLSAHFNEGDAAEKLKSVARSHSRKTRTTGTGHAPENSQKSSNIPCQHNAFFHESFIFTEL